VIRSLVLATLVAVAVAPPAAGAKDWPMFGLSPSRPNATNASIGIRAAEVAKLRRKTVALPGTVDSSPIYAGGRFVMTTTYGRTVAVRPGGEIAWTFTPAGIGGWEGSAQITNASPAAAGGFVYTASPDGKVHKLRLADGREQAGWPVTVTRDPAHEKLTSSFNLRRGRLIVATGGYVGDAPPYQGHVVTIDAGTGRILGVFNSLCSDRREIIEPSSCRSSDSAIWGRAGAVLDTRGRWLVATGNAPFDGKADWGDSILALQGDGLALKAHYTPPNQQQLNESDLDLGSSSPMPIGGGSVVQGGKDATLRVLGAGGLKLRQTLPSPGGQAVFTAPAVWRHGKATTVFVATGGGTTAYAQRDGRLEALWSNATAGTSPLVAGGVLYVYDPGGALDAYRPSTGKRLARLPAGAGHWNSPVPGGGRLALPEGNANDHRRDGVLNLYLTP
jgi:outer membrane protein assembly factor BamB